MRVRERMVCTLNENIKKEVMLLCKWRRKGKGDEANKVQRERERDETFR